MKRVTLPGLSILIGALVVASRRIMEWEKRSLGIEDLNMSDIKYLRCSTASKE